MALDNCTSYPSSGIRSHSHHYSPPHLAIPTSTSFDSLPSPSIIPSSSQPTNPTQQLRRMGDLAFTTESQNRAVGAAADSPTSSPRVSHYHPSSPTPSSLSSASSAATAPAHRSPMMTLALSEERSRGPILPPPPSHPSLPPLERAIFSSPTTSSASMSPPVNGSKSLSPDYDVRSPTSTSSSHPQHNPLSKGDSRPNQQRLTRPTGFRASAALIPMDAPTQPRNYLGPSATSRKDLHVVAQQLVATGTVKGLGRKRSRAAAGLDSSGSGTPPPSMRRTTSTQDSMVPEEEDELAAESIPTLPDTASLVEKLEDKRRKNALSARKSRQLKKETKEALEREVSRLKGLLEECERDRDYWRNVAEEARNGGSGGPPALGHAHDGQHINKLPPIQHVLDAAAAAAE